ncbi:hypothetical protein HDU82_001143 [Entophlyctis luteolus]|nr:hypothetical protein HDU82_001143 [Entophlyctis luteolus]
MEAARHIARLHASRIILAVRSIDKGEAAKRDIMKTASRNEDALLVWQLDLDSADSIKAFALRADRELDRLDAVLANASILAAKFDRNSNGFERTISTNVIGTFLLSLLLLPKLARTSTITGRPSRLSIVCSEVHAWTDLPQKSAPSILDALNDENGDFSQRYPISKLLQAFLAREVAARTDRNHVIVNYLNPGLCHSSLARENSGLGGLIFALLKAVMARTTEAGSRTLVHAIAAGKESHGEYLSDCEIDTPSNLVLSEEGASIQKRIWVEVSAALEKISPGILKNLNA